MRIKLQIVSAGIVLFHTAGLSFAGTTGMLAGYVRDIKTGKVLPGATIVLENIPIGAMADKNGYYIIHNIPPGFYDVKATMIGYTPVKAAQVKIVIDSQTPLDFNMSSEVLDLGTEIIVYAEKSLMQEDITSSTHFLSGGEITEKLPVEGLKEIIAWQPGTVGEHIRGGRATEIIYTVDGLPVQDVLHRDVGTHIPLSSIADLRIQTGGFNAEYGQAMSGVVDMITKEGRDTNEGHFQIYSDHLGFTSAYDNNHKIEAHIAGPLVLSFGGPVLTLNYSLSADVHLTDSPWREDMQKAFSSPISQEYNLNNKLKFKLSENLRFILQSFSSDLKWHDYQPLWRYNLQGLPEKRKKSHQISATIRHTLSPNTFYTFTLGQYVVKNWVLGKQYAQYLPPQRSHSQNGIDWIISGDKQWQEESSENASITRFDLVSQLLRNHQIKAGVDLRFFDIFMRGSRYDELPDSENFGYVFTLNDVRCFPFFVSSYIQDKIKFGGLIINLGIRYDSFHAKVHRPALTMPVDSTEHQSTTLPAKTSELKFQLSPRLGISFPLSQNDRIGFNYGLFFQTPPLSYIYSNLTYPLKGLYPLIGNPELEAEKTIAYEVNYKKRISEAMAFCITGFEKEVFNLIGTKIHPISTNEIQETQTELKPQGYAEFINSDCGYIYGVEISVERSPVTMVSGRFSYTYLRATGTSSSVRENYNKIISGEPVSDNQDGPLDWDQRHTFVLYLSFESKNHWNINLLTKMNSPSASNDNRNDWRTRFDLKASKSFNFFGGQISPFVEIRNLFDNKDTLWDSSLWTDDIGTISQTLYDPGRRIRLGLYFTLR